MTKSQSRSKLKLGLPWLFALVMAGVLAALYWRWFHTSTPISWSFQGREFKLVQPRALALLIPLPCLILGVTFSLADLPWQQRLLGLGLRTLFLSLLVLAIAQPVEVADNNKLATVYLIDVSDSAPTESLEEAQRHVAQALENKRADDSLQLITFAARPRLRPDLLSQDGKLNPDVGALRHERVPGTSSTSAESNLQAALQLAYGVFPPGHLRQVVLLSDGLETRGNIMAEAARAAELGVRVHSIAMTRPAPPEVAVKQLRVPPKVSVGESFNVIGELFATRKSRARARLYQDQLLNGLDGVQDLELEPGTNEVTFRSVVRLGGVVNYRLELDQVESDTFPRNNQFQTRVEVPSRPAILYVEGQPERASYLTSALSAQQFDVDVRLAASFPTSLSALERFGLVIVSDVPASDLGLGAQNLLERYVRDLGGGLVFAGGTSSYGLGGWANTTIERLLPVRMDAEQRKEMPSVAMVLVIDRSGSMTGLPLEMAKAACQATVSTLKKDDVVEVIAFDASPKRFVKMQPARYRSRIEGELMRIQPGGGTSIFPALDAAYQDISVVQARKKHVILLTDGRAEQAGIRDLVQAMIAESITVTTVGLGDAADADLLRMVAETGGGRYHHVPDPSNLPRIFTRETEMISRQSAVQDWFPVHQVSRADFLQGISVGSAPLLRGYVATQMKSAPAQLILASDTGEPILARQRVGLGQVVAWTSDVKNNWSVDWLRWPSFSKFWGQLVREHMRQKHRTELPMHVEVNGNTVRATVDAFTADERFDNGVSVKLRLHGTKDDTADSNAVQMSQVAPGRYEGKLELPDFGAYSLTAEHYRQDDAGNQRQIGVSFGQVSNPYPAEYARFEPDPARLEQVAHVGGGLMSPTVEQLFDVGDRKLKETQDRSSVPLFAALVLFIFDLLLRRVRIFDRGFRPHSTRP